MKHRIPLMIRMAAALLIVAAVLLVVPAQAAEHPKLAALKTSLNLVPEDVSFYAGMFRAGEQIEVIANSRAWAKLVNSPAVQLALKTYEMQKENPEFPAAKADAMLRDAQIQDVLALLADLFDDEAFLYGDASLAKSFELLQKLQWIGFAQSIDAARMAAADDVALALAGTSENREKIYQQRRMREDAQAKQFFQFLAQDLNVLKVPTIVFGSKLDDTDRAELNIGKLEFIVSMGLLGLASQQPRMDFSQVLTRQKIDGGNFIVLKVSGTMLPWEEDKNLMRMAKEDENVAKVIEKIKSENLVIMIGVKGDYLLVSIGPSTEAIENFGHGAGLITRPEMARLEPFAEKRITDIAYVSKEFMALNYYLREEDLDNFLQLTNHGLDLTDLDTQAKDEIRSDLNKLSEQIKDELPEPGAVASISYMTPTGGEGYVFNWGTGEPAAKRLKLLDHLGGTPILGLVAVCPLDAESYNAISDWAKVGWRYFEKYGVPKIPEKDRKEFREAVELFGPVVAALDKTTREQFLPAFGGEFAIQMDAQLTLHNLPELKKPMPMIEPAIILSVKDPELMQNALESYWKTLGDALAAAGTKNKRLASAKLPEPETIEDGETMRHVFSLPAQCPISGDIKPTVGVGKDTLVFAMTPEAARRLMTETSLTYGGVLTDAKKARISAGCFAWKNLIDAARPWVLLGVETSLKKNPQALPLPPEAIRSQAETILDVLSVIRTITSESYRDGDVTVQHNQIEMKDLD